MGDWNITIRGCGPHHNKDYPGDADRMTRKLIHDLRDAGHTIHDATFHDRGIENLNDGRDDPAVEHLEGD